MAQQQMSDEQVRALQERIKNMSPEELKEFQKKQCIFCQIISGKIQAKKIYEDDKVLSILDINPANPGHILIFPKEHYAIMPQMQEDEISHLFIVTKHLSNAMLRSIEAQGTNIIVANGVAAGQRAQHFMIHLIPRKENDGVNFSLPQKPMSQENIETIGDALISQLTGEKKEAKHELPKRGESKAKHEPKKEPKKEEKEAKEEGELYKKPQVEEPEVPKFVEPKRELPRRDTKSGIDLDDIAKLLGAK